jgi:hypothetical protein
VDGMTGEMMDAAYINHTGGAGDHEFGALPVP